jgi:hypothetical protein
MKALLKVVGNRIKNIALPSLVLLLFTCLKPDPNHVADPTSVSIVSFDDQLKVFQKLGFEFNPGTDSSDLNRWGGRKRYEDQPYSVMYMALGGNIDRTPWTPITNKCWHLDRENIKAKDGYTGILKQIQRISGGDIQLENLKEEISSGGISTISFQAKGISFNWKLHIADGAFDADLFSNLVDLGLQLKTIKKFTLLEIGGENVVIGYENRDGLYAIRKATGLHISWMT